MCVVLECSNIATNAAVHFADALRSNRGLQKLDLGNNKISTAGVQQIAESVAFNSDLKELILLGGPAVGDSTLTAFLNAFDTNTSLVTSNGTWVPDSPSRSTPA